MVRAHTIISSIPQGREIATIPQAPLIPHGLVRGCTWAVRELASLLDQALLALSGSHLRLCVTPQVFEEEHHVLYLDHGGVIAAIKDTSIPLKILK